MTTKIFLYLIFTSVFIYSLPVLAGPVYDQTPAKIYSQKLDKIGFFSKDQELYYDGYQISFYLGEPKIEYTDLKIIKLPRLDNYYYINKYLYYLKQINTSSYRDGIGYRLEPIGYYQHDDLKVPYSTQNIIIINNNIYIHGKRMPGIKADSFTLLGYNGSWVGKDDTKVYYNGNEIVGADINSFQLFNQYKDLKTGPIHSNYIVWGKDKNNIYYGGNIFANTAFYKNKKYLKFTPIKPDVATFRLYVSDYKVGDYHEYSWWGVDDKNIFNIYGDIRKTLVNYQKKNGDIYHLNTDGKSFELTGEKTQNGLVIGNGLAKDKNNIYLNHKKISDNASGFKALSGKWSYDTKNLFYNNILVNESIDDLNSFTIDEEPILAKRKGVRFGESYIGKDKNSTYLIQIEVWNDRVEFITKISDLDLDTLFYVQRESNEFYGDKDYIFHIESDIMKIYKGTKNKNFAFLRHGTNFYSNGGIVYYKGKEIKGSDAESFNFKSEHYAIDKNQAYFFTYYKKGSFTDDFKIKYLGKVDNETFFVPHVNPENVGEGSRELGCTTGLGSKDKNNLYCDGIKQNFITIYKYYIIFFTVIILFIGFRKYRTIRRR